MIHNPFHASVFNFHWTLGSAPGPGNDLTINAENNARSELVSLSFPFVADANVVNRTLRVNAVHGLYTAVLGSTGVLITAGQTRYIIIGQHGHTTEIDNGENLYIAIPSFPFLLEGDHITVTIQNKQVGDSIGNPCLCVKLWTYEQ